MKYRVFSEFLTESYGFQWDYNGNRISGYLKNHHKNTAKSLYQRKVPCLFIAECYSKGGAKPCEDDNGTWVNRTCFNTTYVLQFDEERQMCNDTGCFSYVYNSLSEAIKVAEEEQVTSSEEYFKYARKPFPISSICHSQHQYFINSHHTVLWME